MSQIPILLPAVIGSWLLTLLFRKLAVKRRWFDVPNSRSLHELPVPRSGGMAFVLVISGLAVYQFAAGNLGGREVAALLLGLPVAVAGLLDDLFKLSIAARILTQGLCAAVALLSLGGLPPLQIFSWFVDFGAAGWLIGVVGLVWLVNLYNFMDGIDGLAGLEALFVCLAAGFLVWWNGRYTEAFMLYGAAAAVAGFLMVNLPPARVFMGDAGSHFLGFMVGILGLITVHDNGMSIWCWVILLGVFIVDSTMTLLRRFVTGKVWYHAHRSHAYQQAAVRHASHGKVDFYVILINLFWLFPMAWISLAFKEWGFPLAMAAYLPLVMLGNFYNAGIEQRRTG